MSKKVNSVVALFDTPDQIIHAAENTVKAGYKDFDVHTPYPVHGMDHAMSLPGTKLPYVTLMCGLFGFGFALFFQWYVSGDPLSGFGAKQLFLPYWLERYPFVIGGKPLFSLPAFVPVMFEVTVLLSALGTVAAMIAVFCGLPANGHPLHNTDYMKAVSCNRFGLCIEAKDSKFDEAAVREFMLEQGGQSVATVYQPYRRPPSFTSSLIFLGVLIGVAIGVGAKTYVVYNKVLYSWMFLWLDYTDKVKPQQKSEFFADGRTMQLPVDGTVARGYMPYEYKGDPEKAGKFLVNPADHSAEVLAQGKKLYNIYCTACHGTYGDGDGKVVVREAGRGLKPPSLHSTKLKEWPDGKIYHVISEGQNVMPGYAKQILADERWAVVHYVRALQRAKDAKESDLQ